MFSLKGYLNKISEKARIKKIDVIKETEITRRCVEDYLLRAAMFQNGNIFGGMIRGATIHMKNLQDQINKFKEIGLDVDEIEDMMNEYKEQINDYYYVRKIISTPYAVELVKEGWYTEPNRDYIVSTLDNSI